MHANTEEHTHPADADPYAGKWLGFWAIGISFFTMVMAMSMVFVALAPIAEEFDITLRAVGWVVIAESLVITSLMLPMGRLADAVGRKRIHLLGLGLFGLSAVAAALAPTFTLLLVARVGMATGSAMMQSVGTAMVVALFPPSERGTAVGAQTTAVSIGGGAGPLVGGLLLEVVSWRELFLAISIPAAVAIVAGIVLLDEEKVGSGEPSSRFDWAGAVLAAVAVASLVVTISNPFGVPWWSVPTLIGAVVAVGAATTFVRVELRHPSPLLRLDLFRLRAFAYGNLARVLGFMNGATASLLIPIYLLNGRGMSPGAAGPFLLLTPLGMGLAAQVSGRLSDRIGSKSLTMAGFGASAVVALALGALGLDASLGLVAALILLNGLALGVWNVPNNSSILGSVPPSRLGVVGAFTNLTRTIGTVVGQAVAAAVVVTVMAAQGAEVPLADIAEVPGALGAFADGWRLAFLVAAALAAAGLVASILAATTGESAASRISGPENVQPSPSGSIPGNNRQPPPTSN